ncbi:MAG: carboxypeptidase regulatory-like domain-containing protein, partial [Candidatus Acidiferrales bacterium]
MKQNLSKFVGCALAAAFLVVSGAAAQVLTGTITGTVSDPTDAVIPAAQVVAKDLATGREYTATTDTNGVFTLTNLPYGFFEVTVNAQGFAKFVSPRVQVNVAQTSKVVAKMELGKAGSEIVVTAEQSVVETESAELKSSIDRAQIMQMPLPTRNPLDLVRTMPGIVTPTTSGIADAFVHGLRGNSTNITQDGINVADNFVKTSSFFAISAPTVDSTGEFNVSIGGIGVDAGFGAAQVNIRTQRGSNDFHGSAFWYQRTNAFNANTWFNNSNGVDASGNPVSPRPYQLQNRIGFNAGGPVYIPKVYDGRNRTFVFGTYEAFREPLSRSRTRSVLTASARSGMFTFNTNCTVSNNGDITADPGECPSGVTPGQTFNVNLLTLPGTFGYGMNSDVMNYYNAIVPAPNTSSGCTNDGINTQCFQFNLPGTGRQDRYVVRGDHQLTPNHSLEFVYTRANFSSIPDLLNGIEPNFPLATGGGQISKREVYSAAWHSSWGANKTNEVRFGLQRAPVAFDLFEDYAATGGYQLNLPLVTDPTIVQGNLPQGRNTPVRQLMNNFAWSKGSHLWRFGGEWRLVLADSFFFNTVVPSVTIGSATSNDDGIVGETNCAISSCGSFPSSLSSGDLGRARNIYQILTGLVSSVTQGFNHTSPTSGFVAGVPRTVDPIQHNLSGYFQDQWKMWPNFTLNYGVRYEYQ